MGTWMTVAVLIGVLAFGASARPVCARPAVTNAAARSHLVLCCCETFGGGTCCAEVIYCGSYIPGCSCR